MRKLLGCVLSALVMGWMLVSPVSGQLGTGQSSPGDLSNAPAEEPLLSKVPPLTLAGVVDPKVYRVGPGDLIQVQMWGRVSRSWIGEVGPEGVLMLPGSGAIPVAGRTLAQVREAVLGVLRADYRGVSLDVRLTRPRSFYVYLTGQVKQPGPAMSNGASRVGDLLNTGALLEDGSLRRILVTHTDGSRDQADLDLFRRTGDVSVNPWLRDGDIVNVPVATEFIYAQGALAQAGKFELGDRDSLLTLFRLAGDPLPAADASRALLVRWKDAFVAESLWFELGDVYSRTTNPELHEGDHVYVYYVPEYHVQHEASILGEVARPGVYPIQQGRHRLSDLVTAAGGFRGNADLSTIRVFHTTRGNESDPEFDRLIKLSRSEMTDTEYETLRAKLAAHREDFRVDWARLRKSPELDILLRWGDAVRVDPLVSSVRVEGEVRRPGFIEYTPGRSVREYIELGGGFAERADRGKVRITGSATGQSQRARDVQSVAPGDLIWVPERPDVTVWQRLQTLLSVAAQVATVIVVVRR